MSLEKEVVPNSNTTGKDGLVYGLWCLTPLSLPVVLLFGTTSFSSDIFLLNIYYLLSCCFVFSFLLK
jgi:hypothetical protein